MSIRHGENLAVYLWLHAKVFIIIEILQYSYNRKRYNFSTHIHGLFPASSLVSPPSWLASIKTCLGSIISTEVVVYFLGMLSTPPPGDEKDLSLVLVRRSCVGNDINSTDIRRAHLFQGPNLRSPDEWLVCLLETVSEPYLNRNFLTNFLVPQPPSSQRCGHLPDILALLPPSLGYLYRKNIFRVPSFGAAPSLRGETASPQVFRHRGWSFGSSILELEVHRPTSQDISGSAWKSLSFCSLLLIINRSTARSSHHIEGAVHQHIHVW